MKVKFKTNPLVKIPGMKGVWRYVPPGSPTWEPTHFLLLFRKDEAELFDLRQLLTFYDLPTPELRQSVEVMWFSICTARDMPRYEVLRVHCTRVVQASPRLAELIEGVNFNECSDGGGVRGEPHFDTETERNVVTEINAMIHREFFSTANG